MASISLTSLPYTNNINTGSIIFISDGVYSYHTYVGNMTSFLSGFSTFNLATSGEVEATGTSLQNQINLIDASSVIGLTTSGELESTGTSLQNQIFNLNIPSVLGLVNSGQLESTGTQIILLLNNYYPISNPNNFISSGDVVQGNTSGLASSGNLESTGTALQNQIDSISVASVVGLTTSGELESTGTSLQDQINSINVASVIGLTTSGELESTGTQLIGLLINYYPVTNPNNFIRSGDITFNSSGLSTSGNVENTGTSLQNQINSLVIPSVAGLTTSGDLESTGTSLQNQIDAIGSPTLTGIFTGISTGIKSVSSISELRGYPYGLLTSGEALFVKSYYNNGSIRDTNAGGMFIWRPTITNTDDSGRFINPNGNAGAGRYERQISYVPMATYWGAKGDGVTDDTKAIQAAFDALNFSWSSEMHFPMGEYVVSDTIYKGSCRRLNGEGGWTTIRATHHGHIIAGAAFKDWDKLTSNSSSPYYYQLYYEHGFRASDIYLKGDNSLNPGSSTGAGLAVYTPGETTYIDNVGCHYNGVGILSVGGGAPGLRCKTISAHRCTEAVVKLTPLYYNSGWQGKAVVACDIDTLSMDGNHENEWSGCCVLKIWNSYPTVTFRNVKTEGYIGGGIVQWTPPQIYSYATPVGQIIFEGGSVQRNPANNPTGTCALVKIMEPTGGQNATFSQCQRSPAVILKNINQSAIDYLIEDENLKNIDGSSWKLYPISLGGLSQAEAVTPIIYSAATNPTYETGHIHRHLRMDGKTVNRFTPTQTGWYRFAKGVKNINIGLGGSFNIGTPTNSGTYVNFDCYTTLTESYLKIRNSSPLIDGSKILNQVSAVRCGSIPGYPSMVIDVAIEYPFSTSDDPASNYIEIIANDTRNHYAELIDYHFFVDPYIVPEDEDNFNTVAISHITDPSENDLSEFSSTEDINYSFFFDYPYSGLNVAESFIQDNFTTTGIILGVNQTGFSTDSLGCNIYQRLTDGTTKALFANTFLDTGYYYKSISQNNLIATGNNRFVLDITGKISGYQGLSVSILGYSNA